MNTENLSTNALGTYKNVSGETFKIRGVSPMAIEYLKEEARKEWESISNKPLPSRPTYTVETAAKETETYYHSKDTLETEEDKKNWVEWEESQKEVNKLYNLKLIKMCALCIEVDPQKLKEWEEEQAFLGVTIPKNALEKKYRYVETRAITSKVDVIKLISAVFAITGIASEEDIRKAEKSFLDKVERQKSGEPDTSEG